MPLHLFPDTGKTYIDIEKLKAGELASFQQLYRLYYDDFFQYARINLVDKEEAANLVNHCFIRCWYRSNEFTSLNYILGFLNYAVRNKCEQCNNSKGYRSAHHEYILNAIRSGDGLVKQDISADMKNLIGCELGPSREVFMLFYARRMTVKEIGDEMGLTYEYSQERLDLAIRILQNLLKENT